MHSYCDADRGSTVPSHVTAVNLRTVRRVAVLSILSKALEKLLVFRSHSGPNTAGSPTDKGWGRIPFDPGVSLNQHQTRFTQRSAKSSDRHIPKKRAGS